MEPVGVWWARRQWSKDSDVPYPIGTYRADWARYPVLINQYHPEFNHGITLTQIPPEAEVYLLWQCDAGHRFVATPHEQRHRPGRERRRSSWCPTCAELAVRRQAPVATAPEPPAPPYRCGHPRDPDRVEAADDDRCYLCRRLDGSPTTRERLLAIVSAAQRDDLAVETATARTYRWQCGRGHPAYEASVEKMLGGRRCRVCTNAAAAADRYAVGDAFVSPWAPKPASAVEADLRQRLAERFDFDLSCTAVKVARPFFNHVEVWPDIIIPELRIAIEYDSVGRHGLEHVGKREQTDAKKDRLLRAAGWEVVRVRAAKLQPLGPHDLTTAGVTARLIARIDDELAAIRGELIVASYRSSPAKA
ncbi:MAG: hypothetical protein JWM51_2256 [Microbacteriaceae bacterium]|nr:hypothetical protein [Microbacteriaceae bacterium]